MKSQVIEVEDTSDNKDKTQSVEELSNNLHDHSSNALEQQDIYLTKQQELERQIEEIKRQIAMSEEEQR